MLETAKEVGLDAYLLRNNIETRTLEKGFSCLVIPIANKPPHSIRAEISFVWDATLTSESIYGGDCSLYHDETTNCIHYELDPEPFIELEIEYQFEIEQKNQLDGNKINQTLHELFLGIMNHRNLPTIKWEVAINGSNEVRISGVSASHYWHIKFLDEPIEFDEIFEEIEEVLKKLESIHFIKKGL